MTTSRRAVRPTAANRIVVSSCHDCGSHVEWLDQQRAAELGFDLDRAVASFGVRSADELDTWTCTSCTRGGIYSRVASGWFDTAYLQVRAAIDRLGMALGRLRRV